MRLAALRLLRQIPTELAPSRGRILPAQSRQSRPGLPDSASLRRAPDLTKALPERGRISWLSSRRMYFMLSSQHTSHSLKNTIQNPSRPRLVSRLDHQTNDRFGVRSAHVQPAVFKAHLHPVAQVHRTAGVFIADHLQNLADLVRRAFQLLFDHRVAWQIG